MIYKQHQIIIAPGKRSYPHNTFFSSNLFYLSSEKGSTLKVKNCTSLAVREDPFSEGTFCTRRQRRSHKSSLPITKTYQYNFDPLKPHFCIVKLGFTGVHIIFLFMRKNIDCRYPQSLFWAELWKISELFIWKFSSFGGKIFSIFE